MAQVTYYESRYLHDPNNPETSEWEYADDTEGDCPHHVTAQQAANAGRAWCSARGIAEDNVIVAKVTVAYLKIKAMYS